MDSAPQIRPSPQIFLSYASEDCEEVEKLYQKLLDAGYRPWIDKNIPAGANWIAEIKRAIQESDFFLACLSKNSVNKKGVLQDELREALDILYGMRDTDIYLIPVRLEDCKPPRNLRNLQHVDLFASDGWEVLDRDIRKALERPRPPRGIESLPGPQRPPVPPIVRGLPVLVPFFSLASKMVDNRVLQPMRGEVGQTNSIVTIDRPGSEWDVLLFYFIYYVVAAVSVWLVFRYVLKDPGYQTHAIWSRMRAFYKWCKILAGAGAIVLIGFVISLFVLEPVVGSMTDISGSANDQSRKYYLFVRPVGSALCWLQNPVPLIPDQDGKWNTTGFFGGSKGERFEIIAIASRTILHAPAPNPIVASQPFNKPDSYECSLIPGDVERYVRVVVIR